MESFLYGSRTRAGVVAIDDGNLTASVRLSYKPAAPLPRADRRFQVFATDVVDGAAAHRPQAVPD